MGWIHSEELLRALVSGLELADTQPWISLLDKNKKEIKCKGYHRGGQPISKFKKVINEELDRADYYTSIKKIVWTFEEKADIRCFLLYDFNTNLRIIYYDTKVSVDKGDSITVVLQDPVITIEPLYTSLIEDLEYELITI